MGRFWGESMPEPDRALSARWNYLLRSIRGTQRGHRRSQMSLQRNQRPSGARRLIRTTGVFPMVPSIVSCIIMTTRWLGDLRFEAATHVATRVLNLPRRGEYRCPSRSGASNLSNRCTIPQLSRSHGCPRTRSNLAGSLPIRTNPRCRWLPAPGCVIDCAHHYMTRRCP